MCLVINKKENRNLKVAEEDIICYKVVHKFGGIHFDNVVIPQSWYTSPYCGCVYQLNELYKEKAPVEKYNHTSRKEWYLTEIHGGCYHSLLNIEDTFKLSNMLKFGVGARYLDTQYTIVKCIIPKKAKYYEGYFSVGTKDCPAFASKQIKILEEVIYEPKNTEAN